MPPKKTNNAKEESAAKDIKVLAKEKKPKSQKWYYVTDSSSEDNDEEEEAQPPLASSNAAVGVHSRHTVAQGSAAAATSSSSSSSSSSSAAVLVNSNNNIDSDIVSTGEAVKIHESGEVGFVMSRSLDGKSYVIRISSSSKGGGSSSSSSSGGGESREVTKLRSEFKVENDMGKIMAALGQDAGVDGEGGVRNPRRTRHNPSNPTLSSSASVSSGLVSSTAVNGSLNIASSNTSGSKGTVSTGALSANGPNISTTTTTSSPALIVGGRGGGGGSGKEKESIKDVVVSKDVNTDIQMTAASSTKTMKSSGGGGGGGGGKGGDPKKKSGPGWFYVTDSSDDDEEEEDDDETDEVIDAVDAKTGKLVEEGSGSNGAAGGDAPVKKMKKKKGGKKGGRRSTADLSVLAAAELNVVGEKRVRGNTMVPEVGGTSSSGGLLPSLDPMGQSSLKVDDNTMTTIPSHLDTVGSDGNIDAANQTGLKRKGPGRPKVPVSSLQHQVPSGTTVGTIPGVTETSSSSSDAALLHSSSSSSSAPLLPHQANGILDSFLSSTISPRRSAAVAATVALSVRSTKQLERAAMRASEGGGNSAGKKRKRVVMGDNNISGDVGGGGGGGIQMDESNNLLEDGSAAMMKTDEGEIDEDNFLDGDGEFSLQQKGMSGDPFTSEGGDPGTSVRRKKGGKRRFKSNRALSRSAIGSDLLSEVSGVIIPDGIDENGNGLSSAIAADKDEGNEDGMDGDVFVKTKKKAGRKAGSKAVRFARAAAAAAAELAANGGYRLASYGVDGEGAVDPTALEGPDGLLSLPSLPPRGVGRPNASSTLTKPGRKSTRDIAPAPLYERLSNVMRYNLMKHKEEKRTDLGPFVGRLDLPVFGDTLWKKARERGWWPEPVSSTNTSSAATATTVANVTSTNVVASAASSSPPLVSENVPMTTSPSLLETPDKRLSTTNVGGQKRLRFYKLGARRMDKLAAAVTNRWGGYGTLGPYPGELLRISRERTPATYVSTRPWGAGARAGDISSSEEEEERFTESWDPSAPSVDGLWPDQVVPPWAMLNNDIRAKKRAKKAAQRFERPEAAKGDRHEMFLRSDEFAADELFDSYAAVGSTRRPPKYGMWALTSFLEREEDKILYDPKEAVAGAFVQENQQADFSEKEKNEEADEEASAKKLSSQLSSSKYNFRAPGSLSSALSSSGKQPPSALRISLTTKPPEDSFTLYPYERCVHCGVVRDGDADHCWNEGCPLCPLTQSYEEYRHEKKKMKNDVVSSGASMQKYTSNESSHMITEKGSLLSLPSSSSFTPSMLSEEMHRAELLSTSLPALRVPSLAAYKDESAVKAVVDVNVVAVERILEAKKLVKDQSKEIVDGGEFADDILHHCRDILRTGGEESLIAEIERSIDLRPDADNRTSAALNIHYNLSFNSTAREAFSAAAPRSIMQVHKNEKKLSIQSENINSTTSEESAAVNHQQQQHQHKLQQEGQPSHSMIDDVDTDDEGSEKDKNLFTFPSVGIPWIKGSVRSLFPPRKTKNAELQSEQQIAAPSKIVKKLKSLTSESEQVQPPLKDKSISSSKSEAIVDIDANTNTLKVLTSATDLQQLPQSTSMTSGEPTLSSNVETAPFSAAKMECSPAVLGQDNSTSLTIETKRIEQDVQVSVENDSTLTSSRLVNLSAVNESPTSSTSEAVSSNLVTPAVTPSAAAVSAAVAASVAQVVKPTTSTSASSLPSSSAVSGVPAAAAHSFPVGERLGKAKTTPASRKRDATALLELEISAENQFKVYHDVETSPNDPTQKQLSLERAVEHQATEGLDPTLNPGLSLFLHPPEGFSHMYDVWGGKINTSTAYSANSPLEKDDIVQLPSASQLKQQGKGVLYSFRHLLEATSDDQGSGSLAPTQPSSSSSSLLPASTADTTLSSSISNATEKLHVDNQTNEIVDDLIPTSKVMTEAIHNLEKDMSFKLSATADAIIMSDYLIDAPVHFLGRHLHPRSMRYSDTHDLRTLPHSLGNSSYEGLVLSAHDQAKASGLTDFSQVLPIHLRNTDELVARATADEYLFTRAYAQHKGALDAAAMRLTYESRVAAAAAAASGDNTDGTTQNKYQGQVGGEEDEMDHSMDDLLQKASLNNRPNYPSTGVAPVNRDGCQPWTRNSLEYRYASWRNRDDPIIQSKRSEENENLDGANSDIKESTKNTRLTHPMLDGASSLMDMAVAQLSHDDHRAMSQATYSLVNAVHARKHKKTTEAAAAAAAVSVATTSETTTATVPPAVPSDVTTAVPSAVPSAVTSDVPSDDATLHQPKQEIESSLSPEPSSDVVMTENVTTVGTIEETDGTC
jgi:hypothetical protein